MKFHNPDGHTDRRAHKPKVICSLLFSKWEGIKSVYFFFLAETANK